MTTTKQKNVQTANNTTPSNANKKAISPFKLLINQALKNDKEKATLTANMVNVGDGFVKYYINLDIKGFNALFQKDAINNNIKIRLKGHKNLETAKPLTGSATVIISNIKKYIANGNTINKSTTYTDIRKAVAKKANLSEKRKEYNKVLNAMTDSQIKALLELAKKQK